jgi:hypothetical protein
LKNNTAHFKYVSYGAGNGLGFEQSAKNCVDSLAASPGSIYFVKMAAGGTVYLLISHVVESKYKSYIAFGYYLSLSYQTKTVSGWGPLKTLA